MQGVGKTWRSSHSRREQASWVQFVFPGLIKRYLKRRGDPVAFSQFSLIPLISKSLHLALKSITMNRQMKSLVHPPWGEGLFIQVIKVGPVLLL